MTTLKVRNLVRLRGEKPRIPSQLRRITVSVEFWNLVQEHFPALEAKIGYRALFWHLLFGNWHDHDTHHLLIPAKLLCAFEGKSRTNNHGEEFLTRFRHDVLPKDATFIWSGWDPRRNKCRKVLAMDLGSFERLLQLEYNWHWHERGRVYLDGTPFSGAKQKQLNEEIQTEANRYRPQCREAEEIREYMNLLPSNLFKYTTSRNYNAAMSAVLALENPEVVRQQKRILHAIKSNPKPFYGATKRGNTVRLFAPESIASLERSVRKAMTAGWEEADLRCSQLAICARIWDVKEVEDFLRTGENFWSFILKEIGVVQDPQNEIKNIIKKALYAVCFGMTEGRVKSTTAKKLATSGNDKYLAGLFVRHPLIQALLKARERELQSVLEKGEATTCFGKTISVSETREPRQILAEVAQAWEMKLIHPAFKIANSTKDFTICLFQHDGFSVYFRKSARVWGRVIEMAVNDEIERHGFLTHLEWSQNFR